MHDSNVPLIQLVEITRRFPGVLALDDVSLELAAGEVHALVGENGAGKSTLINIISGLLPPHSGRLLVDAREVRWSSPLDARRHGVVTVHQEAEMFGTLSVAENMALEQGMPVAPAGWVRWKKIIDDAQRAVALMGEHVDVRQTASRLSVAQRHMIAIAAAVRQRARVLILDEPTSALTAGETQWLFDQIALLKRAGVGILYISHRQEEIFQLADRITVLRDGRRVWSGPRQAIDAPGLIRQMVGRGDPLVHRGGSRLLPSAGPTRMRLSGLTAADGRFSDISLEVRAGQVLGIYGLVGSGRSELARAIFGLEETGAGTIEIDGARVSIRSPAQARAAGIAYLPEDRLRQGIFRGLSTKANVTISNLATLSTGPLVSAAREEAAANQLIAALSIRCRSSRQAVEELSGGNQQKVVLARWLSTDPAVLILDEPTRGVDVAAKGEIHRLVGELADRGKAVVLISSDLPEVMENSDRIVVFRSGRVAAEFEAGAATSESIAAAALGEQGPSVSHAPRRAARLRRKWLGQGSLVVAAALLCVALSLSSDSFLTAGNLSGLLSTSAVWTILSLGAAASIMAGGIDISLGSLLGLAAGVAALVLKLDYAPALTIPAAVLAALAVGAGCGCLNAALALVGRIHPIVVTLGTMTIYRGLLIWLTAGDTITDLPRTFVGWSSARLLGINGAIAVGAIVVVAVWLWWSQFLSGRYLMALGSSREAAALVGISPARVWLSAFGAGGSLAALAGVVELSQTGAVQSGVGAGYELTAIAAAVIGGVSISGGRGNAMGVCTGAFVLTLIADALVLWQISRYHYSLVAGGLLLAAVLTDLAWRRSEA